MITRLNIKLIVLFFAGLWLFGKAGEILGYLRNPILAEQIRKAKGDNMSLPEGLTVVNIADLVLASEYASLVGLLVGLLIALIICRRRKLNLINPTLSFIIVYLTGWLHIGWASTIVRILRIPGEAFTGIWYYLVNGLTSLLFGLLIFIFINSMKRPNDNYPMAPKPQNA